MKWLIEDVYRLRPFPQASFGLYDLFHLLRKPEKIAFTFDGKKHEVESVPEEGEMSVRFDERWFRTADDFFRKAEIDGELLTSCYEELFDFEVL